jgi:oligopeptide transport system permease protein
VRTAAGALVAVIAFLVLRHRAATAVAALASVALGALAARFAPRLVLVRLLWTVPLFLLLVFVTVQLMFLAPGDPFASEKNAPEAVRRQQLDNYGVLDRSFAGGAAFFWRYVRTVVETGYLGPAIKVEGQSVGQLLLPALPVSMTLGLSALLIAVAIGLALGVRAGLRPNSFSDASSMAFAMVGISLPNFVIGALLMVVFALGLGWFPVAGWGGYRHLVLPAVTLALPYAAYVARLARGGTIDVMSQDFVRTARAKGLPERGVVLKHALRGALAPVVSFLGPAAAGIMTGSFVVEMLFGIPGMGQWFVKGAVNRDYYVVLGTMLIYSGIVIFFNLLVDLAYAWLDPRLRGRA